VTAIDRTAREIGLALGDCGSADGSTLVEEIAVVLVELADEPPRHGRRSRRRKFESAESIEDRNSNDPKRGPIE